MAPEDAIDVKGGCAETLCDTGDLGWSDEEENRQGVDKAADQPRTGDPVDLGSRAGHPHRPPMHIASRQLPGIDHWQAGGAPRSKAAFQHLGLDAFASKVSGNARAEAPAVSAGYDSALPAETVRPSGNVLWVPLQRCQQQLIIGPVPNVDDRGRG